MSLGAGRDADVIVIGASVAGLCAAAAVLAEGRSVMLVERDPLPDDATPRRGVPQGGQLHNMLGRAQQSMEILFPGVVEELVDAGWVAADISSETEVIDHGAAMPRRDLGMRIVSGSQPILEQVLRRRLLATGTVDVLVGYRFRGLEVEEGRLQGIEIEGSDGSRHWLSSPLVIDATGVGTPVPALLRSSGIPLEEQHWRADQWYVTVGLNRPVGSRGDRSFRMAFPSEGGTEGALLSPDGEDRWYLSVNGRSSGEAPTNFEAMLEHCSRLQGSTISEVLEGASVHRAPQRFRRVNAIWHRYDLLDEPVVGLLPIGDALAALNPLFGQGMSVASWEAAVLKDLLADGMPPDRVASGYLSRAADCVRAAWNLDDEVADFFASWSMSDVGTTMARAFEVDVDLHRRYVRLWHLLENFEEIATPLATAMQAVVDEKETAKR